MTAPVETASPYMTTAELATHLRTSVGAVQKMRLRGTGPRGMRRGRHVLYPRAGVEAWEQALLDADEIGQRADT